MNKIERGIEGNIMTAAKATALVCSVYRNLYTPASLSNKDSEKSLHFLGAEKWKICDILRCNETVNAVSLLSQRFYIKLFL